MNPYTMEVRCKVCGGKGMAWEGKGHPWLHDFYHQDPQVCVINLAAKAAFVAKQKRAEEQDQSRLDNFFAR